MFETRKKSNEEIVLIISGSMTGDAVRLFEKALDSLQNSSYRIITLDLTKVLDVSSLFIGHILQCHKNLALQNRVIRICGYPDSVGDIMRMLNVHDAIQMVKEPVS